MGHSGKNDAVKMSPITGSHFVYESILSSIQLNHNDYILLLIAFNV